MSHEVLTDKFGRKINYLRIAITDKCNLRCKYCMPELRQNFLPKSEILSYEELLKLTDIFVQLGIDKIRLTGGEPFVRKGMQYFVEDLKKRNVSLHLTTNATLIEDYLEKIPLWFDSVNISLDSLDRGRFLEITQRDLWDTVMKNIHALLALGVKVNLNMVVMRQNLQDILPMVAWTENKPNLCVRFIEQMPFDGKGNSSEEKLWKDKDILNHIEKEYSRVIPLLNARSSTSKRYRVRGFEGSFGIIPAFSRTFCGECNRIRLTPKGQIRSCLYSHKGLDLKQILRSGASEAEIIDSIKKHVHKKPKDGFEAELGRLGYQQMNQIGG